MLHDTHLREKARTLRSQGYTLPDIMERLSLPKTTIYGWIADMPRPKRNYQTLAQLNGTKACAAKYAKLRDEAYQRGVEEAPELLANPYFRDFIGLYLAEGSKRNRNQITFCNSSPTMILLAHKCLSHVATKPMFYAVQVHVDHDLNEIKEYWGSLLSIDPERIKLQRKSNSGQLAGRNFRSVHGVLAFGVSDTYLRARLQAWMDLLQQQWLDFANE